MPTDVWPFRNSITKINQIIVINQIVINFKVTPKPFLLHFSITCKLKGQKFNQWLRILIPTIIIAMKQNKQSGSKCTTRHLHNIPWRKPMLPERSVRVIDIETDINYMWLWWMAISRWFIKIQDSKDCFQPFFVHRYFHIVFQIRGVS